MQKHQSPTIQLKPSNYPSKNIAFWTIEDSHALTKRTVKSCSRSYIDMKMKTSIELHKDLQMKTSSFNHEWKWRRARMKDNWIHEHLSHHSFLSFWPWKRHWIHISSYSTLIVSPLNQPTKMTNNQESSTIFWVQHWNLQQRRERIKGSFAQVIRKLLDFIHSISS